MKHNANPSSKYATENHRLNGLKEMEHEITGEIRQLRLCHWWPDCKTHKDNFEMNRRLRHLNINNRKNN
jgi:hypothetical protein